MNTSQTGNISVETFWNTIAILRKNFHAVNKKLFGVKTISLYEVLSEIQDEDKHKIFDIRNVTETTSAEVLSKLGLNLKNCSEEDIKKATGKYSLEKKFILVTKLLTKKIAKNECYNIQFIDSSKKEFYNILQTDGISNMHFFVKLSSDNIIVGPIAGCSEYSKCENWCNYVLQPKLLKWATISNTQNKKSVESLKLVDIEKYNTLYNNLKCKYGKSMVEIWPETTDPLKFVYEDIAIATYLILLWAEEDIALIKFVDMGCGNGLLVHILNSEGFNGYGIDIRKRKIWDLYPSSTKLEEKVIIPNNFSEYKDVNWIIGNHSDELTLWIPIIASMCSYKANYFVLPCCAYQLSGQKYQRKNSNISLYMDFLNYVEEVSNKSGFITLVDRLKIPSTKRIVYIGKGRMYGEDFFLQNYEIMEDFLKSEANVFISDNIKLREKDEVVRNCTKIDKQILDQIVIDIFNFIICTDSEEKMNGAWRIGRTVSITDVVEKLSKTDLLNIKSQCGGLKTLLKNNHEIFHVLGNNVQLRQPKRITENHKDFQYKKRKCFFFLNHPDSCPLEDKDCSFKHT